MGAPVAGHVVLVGMMGSGKSTVGELVAERLGLAFGDSDALVEARTGRTVAQIFAEDGEPAFRAEERVALAEMLARPEPWVIAAAGGTVLDADSRAALRQVGEQPDGVVVWLRAEPDVLVARARTGSHRPLLDDDPEGTITRLVNEREALYRDVAVVVVDVDRLQPGEIADEIVAHRGSAS